MPACMVMKLCMYHVSCPSAAAFFGAVPVNCWRSTLGFYQFSWYPPKEVWRFRTCPLRFELLWERPPSFQRWSNNLRSVSVWFLNFSWSRCTPLIHMHTYECEMVFLEVWFKTKEKVCGFDGEQVGERTEREISHTSVSERLSVFASHLINT